mgnify:FL=1
MFPELLYFSASDAAVWGSVVKEMSDMGFELTAMGEGCYAVNAIPSGLEGLDVSSLMTDMVASATDTNHNVKADIRNSLALSLARSAAIPMGQVLSNEEMEGIVNALFACENVNYTPDGKKILGILQQKDLENLLK